MESNKTVAEIELEKAKLNTDPSKELAVDTIENVLNVDFKDLLPAQIETTLSSRRNSAVALNWWRYTYRGSSNEDLKSMSKEALESAVEELSNQLYVINEENTRLQCDLTEANQSINKLKEELKNYKEVENDW